MKIRSIGVVEIFSFTVAVELLDEMLKTSNVTLLNSERVLGGALVTLIIEGETSDVAVAIEKVREDSERQSFVKNAVIINNPHDEILKFIIPSEAI